MTNPIRPVFRTFLRGLIVLLPFIITIAIIVWLVAAVDTTIGGLLRAVIWSEVWEHRIIFPGMSLLLSLVLIFIVGLWLKTWTGQWFFSQVELVVNRIPLVKTLYDLTADVINMLRDAKKTKFSRVVAVKIGDTEHTLIGLVTRDDLSGLPEVLRKDDRIAVYLPMSYQIGGYMTFIPRSSVIPLDMKMENAMRLILTAGVSMESVPPTALASTVSSAGNGEPENIGKTQGGNTENLQAQRGEAKWQTLEKAALEKRRREHEKPRDFKTGWLQRAARSSSALRALTVAFATV